MKYIHTILIVLLTGLLNLTPGFAATSTSLSLPTQQTAVTQVTVVVTHIAPNVSYNHSVYCPSPGSGGSTVVKNATLIGNDKFFPLGPTYWYNGWVVYTCSETYWSNDTYYTNLVNTNTIACVPSRYTSEICTIKGRDMNNMIGVLPIHFKIITPSQTIVRNQAYSAYNRIGSMAPSSPYPQVSGSLSGYVPNGGWAQEFSFVPGSVGLNLSVNLLWQATYTQTDGAGNGYSFGGNGSYDVLARCPDYSPFPNAGYYNIPISNDMLGKTCTLACNEGKWNLYGPTGNPNDNATGGSGTYFGAPLTVTCE